MTPDYTRAAVKAAETLIKYGVRTVPISPMPVLEQIPCVIVTSFAEMSDSRGIREFELLQLFGKNRDAVTSVHRKDGKSWYVVAYNSMLPFTIIQHAMARELGHIVLGHNGCSAENDEEAICFAHHFLCPRPLIRAIQATCIRVTNDILANMTGVFYMNLKSMRKMPGTDVPPNMNRFIRGQFLPFIVNFFEYYQTVIVDDGSAIVDFGTYMDGYEE